MESQPLPSPARWGVTVLNVSGGLLAALALLSAGAAARFVPMYGAHLGDFVIALGIIVAIATGINRLSRLSSGVCTALAFLLGLALRLIGIYLFHDAAQTSDPGIYSGMANRLLLEGTIGAPGGTYGPDLRALYPPLYPVVLAGFRAFLGDGIVSIFTLNLICDCLASVLMWRLALRWADAPTARAAAMLYFLFPPFMLSSAIAQKESLVLVFVLALAFGAIRLFEGRDRLQSALLMGGATGLLGLTQPAYITLGPLAFGALLIAEPSRFRQLTSYAAVAGFVAILCLLPWWVRNWLLWQRFVPLTDGSGIALTAAVRGAYVPISTEIANLPEPDRFQAVGRLAVNALFQDPAAYVQRLVVRVGAGLINNDDAGQRFGFGHAPSKRAFVPVVVLVAQLSYSAVLAACARSLLVWHHKLESTVLPLFIAVCVVQMFVFNVWLEFSERHRLYLLLVEISVAALWLHSPRRASMAPLRQ